MGEGGDHVVLHEDEGSGCAVRLQTVGHQARTDGNGLESVGIGYGDLEGVRDVLESGEPQCDGAFAGQFQIDSEPLGCHFPEGMEFHGFQLVSMAV